MGLDIGIVGLPNVGKSTVFNALTKNAVPASNYPFATVEPNVGVVGVPDARLATVADIVGSSRTAPATVRFVDIAGLVRGASAGHGLGNRFLAHIRETDAICQVVRVFASPDVVHVAGEVAPAHDIETVNTELVLADLETVERALPRLRKEAAAEKKTAKDRAPVADAAAWAREVLDSGQTLYAALARGDASAQDAPGLLRELHLLTAKPVLYAFNMDEDGLGDAKLQESLRNLVAPAEAVFLDAEIEAEALELPESDAAELLAAMGQPESGLSMLIRASFATLGLRTFITANAKEAHAWTIRSGATAWEAARAVHTDFQRNFVRAEVVAYGDLVAAGSLAEARAAGKVRGEGRDYVVQDGDIVEIRAGVRGR